MLQPFIAVQEQPEFRKLWVGNLVSAFGSRITHLALPLTAVVMLRASPVEMGALAAAGTLPNLLLGLPAGVVVDRLPRRLILVVADVGRTLLLASIPAAALLGRLRMEHLYVVSFLTAVLDLFFDLASISLVPVILGRERLIDGNTALTMNDSVAKIAGPSLAGVLIQALTAPVAILLDAVSFLVSAVCAAALRIAEPPLASRTNRWGWWADLVEGFHLVMRDRILRSILGASILGSLAGAVQAPLLILFLARELGLSPTTLGVLLAVSGLASIPGSLLARPVARWVGQGRAIATGTCFTSMGMLLLPLADGPLPAVLVLLVASQLLTGIGLPIYAINQLTLRQSLVPNHLQGRANATRRFFVFGTAPLGAVLGGYLGQEIGPRPTLLLGALLMGSALLWTVCSPLWSLRETPSEEITTVPG